MGMLFLRCAKVGFGREKDTETLTSMFNING